MSCPAICYTKMAHPVNTNSSAGKKQIFLQETIHRSGICQRIQNFQWVK